MTILQGQKGSRYELWWEDPAFYTLYDDFGNASIDGTKWDVSAGVVEAGGDLTGQLNTGVGDGGTIVYANSKIIPSNRSIWGQLRLSRTADDGASGCQLMIGNATDGWTACHDAPKTGSNFVDPRDKTWESPMGFVVVALGGNQYDVYVGQEKTNSAVTKANGCQIRFVLNHQGFSGNKNCAFFASEVRYSNQ